MAAHRNATLLERLTQKELEHDKEQQPNASMSDSHMYYSNAGLIAMPAVVIHSTDRLKLQGEC